MGFAEKIFVPSLVDRRTATDCIELNLPSCRALSMFWTISIGMKMNRPGQMSARYIW